MSYARHSEDDLHEALDGVQTELDEIEAAVKSLLPTCSGRGVTDHDLDQVAFICAALAKHRIAVLAEINQRVRGMG
ncbi:hypothetical protein [Roseomonas xinghualingensis]|uniref:hypothetical protein n=1 Tax=Roseomonas xinghualingensis TaxID=2986475 RepID=UPI0021F0E2E9|nr:hypothetical protein [Roseomonas sp. SXEYE001]MCV4210276.1 hypothetical protein [Roseomonas sp. SXEYE001]